MNLKHLIQASATSLILASMLTLSSEAKAETYLLHKDIAGKAEGSYYNYKDRYFQVGTTAFNSWWTLANKLQDGDIIYFGPQATGNITINKNNLTLLGANAFCDAWSGQRNNAAESSFTGTLTIANGVSGTTINGFLFTGEGCVRNETSGRGTTALHDISLVYNKCENTTIVQGDDNAIFFLGKAYRPNNSDTNTNDPSKWAANCRYENVTIAHNAFYGKYAANQPACIQVAGSYGTLNIEDNRFENGGCPINIFNLSGDFNIKHNQFKNVGQGLNENTGGSKGEFCIRLFYIGVRSGDAAVNGYIRHNIFDGCQGQSSMYSLIRFYAGNTSEAKYPPVNTALFINHNTFKNKTSFRDASNNYVFYADKGTCTDGATVDMRFNRYDQSELQFAWVKPAWMTEPGRFYASSTEIFEHTTAKSETEGTGTLIDYYGAKTAPDGTYFGGAFATGNRLKSNTFTNTTVVQSFDRDDVTGDFYFVQVQNGTYGNKHGGGYTYTNEKPLTVTRTYKTTTTTKGWNETKMYLDWAGHGSNMAVININGTLWIVTGGNSISDTDPNPKKVCFVPYVAGAYASLNEKVDAFTYGGKTYNIKRLNRNWVTEKGLSEEPYYPYPSIDRDNNLLVERSRTSGGDYFTVYELTDAFNNPETCKPIGQVFIAKGTAPMTTSSRDFYKTADKGFKTWSDQGFTISGDYIYTYEGNSLEGYSGTPTPTDGKPTQIVNVANWRTGEFVYRKAILKTTVYGSSDAGPYKINPGEPEGLKIHRDDSGRANLLIGVVEGASGARKFNVFAYRQKRVNGQGRVFDSYNPTPTMTPAYNSLDFISSGGTDSKWFRVKINGEARDVHASIVGPDGYNFNVEKTAGDEYASNHDYSVKFTPTNNKVNFSAYLKLSTPNASDILVPLNGTYTGELTGIEDISTDNVQIENEIEGYYDLMGRRLTSTDNYNGYIIIRYTDGSAEKILK